MHPIEIFEQIAESGHAPKEGCALFGFGYDDALERLHQVYLAQRFARGGSSEKFVVGPYGSGKTHFLRHLSEIAREIGCVTSEVAFNQDLDPVQSLMVYQEVARQVRAPNSEATGIKVLVEAALKKIEQTARERGVDIEEFQLAWAAGLEAAALSLSDYGKVLREAAEGTVRGQAAKVDAACRWLTGDVSDKTVAATLRTRTVPKSEHNLVGRRCLLSLLQFVRLAGFHGTVVGFDEADQGLQVDRKKLQKILSMFQAGINALQDLKEGSGLIVYAVTPQIIEDMEKFPALQQRVVDPGPGQGFFDGNTLAPKINLTLRPNPDDELRQIAAKLVGLFFDQVEEAPIEKRKEADGKAREVASEVARQDPTSSARRLVTRRVCTMLLGYLGTARVLKPSIESEV